MEKLLLLKTEALKMQMLQADKVLTDMQQHLNAYRHAHGENQETRKRQKYIYILQDFLAMTIDLLAEIDHLQIKHFEEKDSLQRNNKLFAERVLEAISKDLQLIELLQKIRNGATIQEIAKEIYTLL